MGKGKIWDNEKKPIVHPLDIFKKGNGIKGEKRNKISELGDLKHRAKKGKKEQNILPEWDSHEFDFHELHHP